MKMTEGTPLKSKGEEGWEKRATERIYLVNTQYMHV
jgi:hypothetical protein